MKVSQKPNRKKPFGHGIGIFFTIFTLVVLFSAFYAHVNASGSRTNTFVWIMDTGGQIGEFHLIKMTPDGSELWRTQFGQSLSIGVDPNDGSVWAPELNDNQGNSNQVVKLNANGSVVLRVEGFRTGKIGVDPTDGSVWVGLPNENEVVKLNANGEELFRVAGFDAPASIAVDPTNSNVWIADGGGASGRKVVKLDRNGQELFRRNTPGFFSNAPQQIAIDPRDGSAWYTGFHSGNIFKLSADGTNFIQVGGFDRPVSVAVDPRDGSLWVSDFSTSTPGAVVKLDRDGNELLRKTLNFPPRIASVNPDDGSVWVGIEGALIKLSSMGSVLKTISQLSLPKAIVIADVIEPPDNFVFLANDEVKIDRQAGSYGDIHSNGNIEFKKGGEEGEISFHTGNLTAVSAIAIAKGNYIDGRATAGEELVISDEATVTGGAAIGTVDPVDLPTLPGFVAGNDDVEVDKDDDVTLAPGAYDTVAVGEHATLRLYYDDVNMNGEYNLAHLEINPEATLSIDVANGPVTINLEGGLEFKKEVMMEILNGFTSDVTINSLDDIKFGKRSVVLGTFIAPDAKVELKNNLFFKGVVCADRIKVKKYVTFVHHSSSTSIPSSPSWAKETGEEEQPPALPSSYLLHQNYPNPFNPATNIGFRISERGFVSLKVYDISGREVATLVAENLMPGSYEYSWDATGLASGVYFYRITAGNASTDFEKGFSKVRKMVLLR